MRARVPPSWTAWLLAAAIAAAPLAAHAQAPAAGAPAPAAGAQAPQPTPAPDPERAARMLTIGNGVQVLYDLMAQELIDQLALPGPGDAARNARDLALVLMIAASDDPSEDDVLLAAMRGLVRATAQAARSGAPLPYWGGRVDRVGARTLACTFAASEPDEFRALASELALSEAERTACGEGFAALIRAWGPPLRAHMSDTGDARPRGTAGVSWRQLEGYDLGEAVRPLRESGAVERLAATVAAGLRLPHDIAIRMEPCGRIEARRENHTITVCYELMEAYGQLMAASLRDDPPR